MLLMWQKLFRTNVACVFCQVFHMCLIEKKIEHFVWTKIAQSPHRQHVRSTRARRDAHLRKNTCMDARTHVLSILRTRLSKSIRAACVYWPRLRHQVRNRKTWFLSLLARLFVLGNRSSPYACRAPSIFLHWIPIWRHKERRNWNTHTSGPDTYFTYKTPVVPCRKLCSIDFLASRLVDTSIDTIFHIYEENYYERNILTKPMAKMQREQQVENVEYFPFSTLIMISNIWY